MRSKVVHLALSGILAFGATSAIVAQTNDAQPQQWHWGHHGRMNPDAQLQHLTKALDLSPDQQSQIKPVLEARQQQIEALFQDQSLSREDRHSKAQAIRTDTHAKIEAVLNDQQKQKFEAMQARMQERMQERQGNDSTAPQPQ
jgi:Spy/CpxP family protein refolding chaperone